MLEDWLGPRNVFEASTKTHRLHTTTTTVSIFQQILNLPPEFKNFILTTFLVESGNTLHHSSVSTHT